MELSGKVDDHEGVVGLYEHRVVMLAEEVGRLAS